MIIIQSILNESKIIDEKENLLNYIISFKQLR